MRGENKIKSLTSIIIPQQTSLFTEVGPTLYEEKVKLITARYYYFLTNGDEKGKLKYEDILLRLSKEFFISTGRIADILVENSDALGILRKESPKPSWFKIQWAHLVW